VILDTSPIIAYLKDEPTADWVEDRLLGSAESLRMSWVNVAEVGMACERLLAMSSSVVVERLRDLRVEFLVPDVDVVATVIAARRRFPLNFGDCFAYAHAKLTGEPLLTLDSDFLKTDLAAVLHPDG